MQINPVPELFISENVNSELAEYISGLNCIKVFIVTGPHISKTDSFIKLLNTLYEKGLEVRIFSETTGDPTFFLVDNIVEFAREFEPEMIVGIGGGEPIRCG